jgi:hypothetical protein
VTPTVRTSCQLRRSVIVEGHTGAVSAVAFAGGRLFSGSWDDTIRVWREAEERWRWVVGGVIITITIISMIDLSMIGMMVFSPFVVITMIVTINRSIIVRMRTATQRFALCASGPVRLQVYRGAQGPHGCRVGTSALCRSQWAGLSRVRSVPCGIVDGRW